MAPTTRTAIASTTNNLRGWLGSRHYSKHFKFNIYWVSKEKYQIQSISLQACRLGKEHKKDNKAVLQPKMP